jgi:hypothetical protein
MRFYSIPVLMLALAALAFAGDNLKLNPKLDYSSDSQDGPLITGDHMDAGAVSGKPTYIILYGEGCFNSKTAGAPNGELVREIQRPRAVCCG